MDFRVFGRGFATGSSPEALRHHAIGGRPRAESRGNGKSAPPHPEEFEHVVVAMLLGEEAAGVAQAFPGPQ